VPAPSLRLLGRWYILDMNISATPSGFRFEVMVTHIGAGAGAGAGAGTGAGLGAGAVVFG
jgi:hypothetical protein